ncbi:XPP2-like protein [Mya arenaria]|uniref:XPP2-like protein n=1 Tax=Mya arenaria TaxID=6604 RepID=A0ABY7EJZ0_MYAAR|nr:XPP2-like protein [Mya arenaria]
MREREIGVPSMIEWLKSVLTNGQTLGASPFLSSSSSWKANEEALQAAGIDMKAVSNELIDALWNNDRPAQPNSPINALPIQFAGVSWENKVTNMREQMAALGTDMMVREYEPITVTRDVDNRAQRATGVLIGYACNQAIYAAIPNKGKIVQMNTPIATTKTMKNSVEVEGMKKSHIRDAVALISFLERLEREECYTRVMMGHINLFLAKFRKGVYGREIDAYARGPLWDVGLVYRHGTGHGIGMYLSVHEEPGYYEDGKFGIRLENIVMVTNASTKYHFPGTEFLTFEHVTLVPYAPNLINYDLLDDKQIQYLNDYNELVRSKVGPELQRQGKTAAYEWMRSKTERYEKINPQTPNTEKFSSP